MPDGQKKDPKQHNGQTFPIYSLLVGIYPVLALAAFNISQIDLSTTYRSLLLSAALALLLFGLLRLLLRDWSRAAFLSLLLLVLFYSYGHVYNLIKTTTVFGFAIGRHRLLAPFWAVLAGLAVWISTRKSISFSRLTTGLNIVTALLLILPVFQITTYELANRHLHSPTVSASAAAAPSSAHSPSPDIYYIILDAYMRSDNLQVVYNYDNSAFIKALTQRGFYVATCSQSNYAWTQPSLTSSLNMDYLDKLSVTSDAQADPLLQENAVRLFLKAHGYTDVAFETGWSWSQWENADVYYRYHPNGYLLNAFETLYLQTTLVRIALDRSESSEITTDGAIHHNLIIANLGILKNLPKSVQGPKFVFAHLVIPHLPFVFGPNGEFVTYQMRNPDYLDGYRNAVTFISKQILQVVDRILADSTTPPIIVIQGDHGAPHYLTHEQRLTILNAYYLPGEESRLYPTITPVNTFRIILDAYFGQDYPLLPDVSRYSTLENQYSYELIPNPCGK